MMARRKTLIGQGVAQAAAITAKSRTLAQQSPVSPVLRSNPIEPRFTTQPVGGSVALGPSTERFTTQPVGGSFTLAPPDFTTQPVGGSDTLAPPKPVHILPTGPTVVRDGAIGNVNAGSSLAPRVAQLIEGAPATAPVITQQNLRVPLNRQAEEERRRRLAIRGPATILG